MLEGLIAEISNHHEGDLNKAFELIRVAKESGADYVKMQAIEAESVKTGSMPVEFYEKCSMSVEEYSQCVHYGTEIGIPVFFSVFGEKYEELFIRYPLMIRKIASGQVGKEFYGEILKRHNHADTIISVRDFETLKTYIPLISKMNIMFVTPYNCSLGNLSQIKRYEFLARSKIGFSDHSLNVENCKEAISDYGCKLIEKHFYLGKNISWKGQIFRDCLHSANPTEFENLATFYREKN